jgi:hypothetical protein
MNRVRHVPVFLRRTLIGTMVMILVGCAPKRLTVPTDVPSLLVVPMPATIGLRMPKSFTEYVQKENVQNAQWQIELGSAQAEAMRRVMGSLFEHVVVLGEAAPGGAAGQHLDGIIETTLDSYVYLLPSPASGASEFYSATIGFKVNLEAPDGTLLGSWVYEGYGSVPERGLTNFAGVKLASALAIRDACANLAVHLPEQELLRNLLAPPAKPAPAAAPPEPAAPAPAANPAPEANPAPTVPEQTPAPAQTPPPPEKTGA